MEKSWNCVFEFLWEYLPAQVQSLARNLVFHFNLFLHDSSRYEWLYMYLTFMFTHKTNGLLVRCTGNSRKRPALYMEAENCIKLKTKGECSSPLWSLNFYCQGSHRLEKYVNLRGFLEMSLKIKYALKSTWKYLKCLEKSLNSSIYCRDLTANAAPNKGTIILY